MNIVYFGTDAFSKLFEYFLENHNILALYTYHNDEDYFTERGVVQRAHSSGIPVHYDQITLAQIEEYVQNQNCDLFFVGEYSSKIPVPPDLPGFRGINTHSAPLPMGRSYYPIELAMKKGCATGGVTLHKLAPALDGGDILAQKTFPITAQDDSIDVYLHCAAAAQKLLREIMEDFDAAWQNAVPQTVALPYWRSPAMEARQITPEMSVAQAVEQYRCFNRMCMVSIDSALYYVDTLMPGRFFLGAGNIIRVSDRRVLYGLRDGHIRLDLEAVCDAGGHGAARQ